MRDLRQREEYTNYMREIGWHVIEIKNQNVKIKIYIRRLPFIGNLAKLQRPEKIPSVKQLDRLVKEHNLAVLYIEPTIDGSRLTNYGFVYSKHSFVPAKTIHIDLTKSEKELLEDMKHKTRYNIKQAQKRGVVVKESTDIEAFIELWHSSARRRRMFLPQKKELRALYQAFGSKTHILLAYNSRLTTNDSQPLGGVLVVRTREIGYYMYAASTKEGNKLFAPTLLAWEAIRLIKRKKCKIFDFEGIYDERYPETKRWKGFTRFKEGFGGKVVTHPRTLVKYYNIFAKILNL